MGEQELLVAPAVPQEPKSDNYLKNILNLFLAPTKTFASLAVKPRWLIPFILCVIVSFTYEATTNQFRMADIKEKLRTDPSISAEELQRRTDNIDAQAIHGFQIKALGIGVAILTTIQAFLLFGLTLIIWLALQLSFPKPKFISLLSLVSFTFLISLPEAVLKIPLIHLKETAKIYFSAAAFLPSAWEGSILFRFLDGLNIFSIWMVILLMIGIPLISEISRKRAIITISYLWLIWLILYSVSGGLVNIV